MRFHEILFQTDAESFSQDSSNRWRFAVPIFSDGFVEAILNTFEQTNYRKLQVIHYLKWNGAPSGKYVGDERFFRPIHGFPLENAT